MQTMVMFGVLPIEIIFSLMEIMAIGCIQKWDGVGFRHIDGDEHPSIMADGFMIHIMDGYGSLVTSGLRHGLLGEKHQVIMDGLH